MADVMDAVLADRTLSGKASGCIPTNFAPGEIKFENKLFYGGEIRFQALEAKVEGNRLFLEAERAEKPL